MRLENEQRPRLVTEGAEKITGEAIGTHFTAHRCRRCGATLTARASVARELGPICWHHARVEAEGVTP